MPLEKAVFFDPDVTSPTYNFVQFNPASLEYSYGKKPARGRGRKNSWANQHQQQSSLDDWEESTLTMHLFFNTYVNEGSYTDVREEIKKLRKFLCKTEEKLVNNHRVEFAWGTFAFKGFLNSMHVAYKMFGADGTPVQAEANLSISGEESDISNELRQYMLNQAGLPTTGRVQTQQELTWLFQ